MRLIKAHPWYAQENSQRLTTFCFIVIAAIAILDSVIVPIIGLGFIYLVPLVVAAAFLSRWQILMLSAICAVFWEAFSRLPGGPEQVLRVTFAFLAYSSISLLIRRMVIYQRAASRRLGELEHEISVVDGAKQRLELLINSSPVGMITTASNGHIVQCNKAAHDILGVAPGGLAGAQLGTFFPTLVDPVAATGPAPIECSGRKANGAPIVAKLWNWAFPESAPPMTATLISINGSRDEERK